MRLLLRLLISFAFIVNSLAEINEENKPKFRVIRAVANNLDELQALRKIHDETQHDVDFWLTPSQVGHKADIMVDDFKLADMKSRFNSNNVTFNVIIDDVEKLIIERERQPKKPSIFGKRLNDEGGNRAKYGFGEYHSYDTIVEWLRDIERKYPERAKVFSIGTTVEGRPIYGIKIGRDVNRTDKKVFWLDAGIHAREWAAVHTGLWFIDRLIADYDDDPIVHEAIDKLNFYAVPVVNPDGYEYSRSDVSPMVRLWRKNRAGVVCKKDRWFRDRCCGGVDLNRNFDWYFGDVGSSSDKCSEIYQGARAFSENESRAIRDKIYSDELKGKVDGFITLHTYSQMWIHPFSHQRKTVPEDIADIERVGRAAVAALENTYGTTYKFGTGSDILYPSSGGSDDWAKGKVGCKYVYLIELRPGEDVWDGFILDQRQLIPTAKETWNGVKVVIKAVSDRVPTPFTDTATIDATTTTIAATTTALPTTSSLPPPTSLTSTTLLTNESTASNKLATTAATHLNAFYQLGKRRYKFVSIKTFQIGTSTPMPRPRLVTLPSFAPTVTLVDADAADDSPIMKSDVVIEGARQPVHRPVVSPSTVSSRLRRPNSRILPAFRTRVPANIRPPTQEVTNGQCVDRSVWCNAWLQANRQVCQISSIYMRRDCARTCGFCH